MNRAAFVMLVIVAAIGVAFMSTGFAKDDVRPQLDTVKCRDLQIAYLETRAINITTDPFQKGEEDQAVYETLELAKELNAMCRS